ncbi:MAG TPA: NPCBM/NEW2 domain-containing protein [Pirellulales bacterium]|nr:NPCBM/NEW2 domain-containing protein [Pirellulales bacterium]
MLNVTKSSLNSFHLGRLITLLAPLLVLLATATAAADIVRLEDLGFNHLHQDWGKPGKGKSVDGHPLTIAGKVFEHGLGSHASSSWWIDLAGKADRFTASVGVDDEVKDRPEASNFPIEFRVIADGKALYHAGKMKLGDRAKEIDLDLHGIHTLVLLIEPMGPSINFGHGDWTNAIITYTGRRPTTIEAPRETAEILTPKPSAAPRINGATVLGVRPGHPVLYTIAATGERPMTFAAEGLPAGLSVNSKTGRITGAARERGESVVTLNATNSHGSAERKLRIKVGDAVALTPPMGWNSWNCFATSVSDKKVRAAADAMVSSGLVDHGWTYINIDDCWEVSNNRPPEARRNADGRIKTNDKFPGMKPLADYIHAKGLRAGIYSSPGPTTCGNFTASYNHEEQDAEQYARWGFDYLKYDWCSYDQIAGRETKVRPYPQNVLERPYAMMRDALAKQDRDIVVSLCQYGMGDVWRWGASVGGNCWRVTGDISDNWASMAGIGFGQTRTAAFAGPGHWNDPDMLVVGSVGWGNNLHPTHLTPNEQYTHISLWCLQAAPLLIGCDMTQLDEFTLGLLTNDEVLAIDQDPLGKQAVRILTNDDGLEIWAKSLEDGAKAVGLFNRGEMPSRVTARWSDLGLSGNQPVRDLWRQKNLGEFDGQFSADVARHGVVLVRVGAAK